MAVQKKKILIITTSTNVYGAEINMLKIIDKLYHSSDYIVHTIISGWSDGLFEKKLNELEVKHFTKIKLGWLYKSKILWSLDSILNYIPSYIKYIRLQKSFNPDLIFVNSYRLFFLLYPFIKCQVVLRVQDQLSNDKQGIFVIKKTKTKISKFYAVSNFIKNDLIKLSIEESKIVVIHNGIDFSSEKKLSKQLSEKIRIGIVGQVNHRKGHHILVQALNILKKKGYSFSLKIFGSGSTEYVKEIKQLVDTFNLKSNVEWKGYIPDKDKIYNELDLVVCPAILPESFGLTAIEPAAYKIPVITSNIGAFNEIIREGINGFKFNNEDFNDLAEKIEYFFMDNLKILMIGDSAYKYVKENFSSERMLKEVKSLIDDILHSEQPKL